MTASDDALDPTQRLNTRAEPVRDGDASGQVLQPGERIANYRVISVLGSGGMGEVYRAEQLEPVRRTVALKRLRQHRLDARQLAWFEIERQVLAQMQHPAIAQIFDAGTDHDGTPFFAMEYIEGESLLRYCEQHALPLRARIELLIRVCEGVQHAHQKGIIHRDLKPANILVSTVDGRALPRIIDFGIATATSRSLAAGQGGEIVGTPDYMSPEQAGLSPYAVDLRSDVYALGVMLYELLTGQRPTARVTGESSTQRTTLRAPSAVLADLPDQGQAVARKQGVRPSVLRRKLRDDLDWVVLKAIAEQRDARYASVEALADDLRCYLEDRPVLAAPGGPGYQFGKLVRRHRLAIIASTFVLVALFAGLALSLYGLWQADAQREVAETRGRELEQVVAFQQATLKDIDVAAMGTGLIAAQRAQLEAQLAGDAQGAATLAGFDAAMQRIAPSDLARTLLDRFVLTGALNSVDRDFANQPRLAADLRASAAEVYTAIAGYSRAVELWRSVLQTRQQELGADATPTLMAELELGTALNLSGDLNAAQTVQQAMLVRTDHRDLPLALRERIASDYAITLNDLGRTAEALDVQTALLAKIVAERGEEDARVLKLRNNLAISLVRAGRPDEARVNFEAVLAVREKTLPPDAPELLDSMLNAAAIRGATEDYDGAFTLQQQVYDAMRRLHGDEHAYTLSTANNLASTLSRMQRTDEAIALLQRSIPVAQRVLGPTHPDTLRWKFNLAAVLARGEQRADAVPLLREVVQAREATLGPDHPDTLRARTTLGDVLGKLEQWDEALALSRDSLARRRSSLGELHPDTIESRLILSSQLGDMGDLRGSIDELRGAMTLALPERLQLEVARRLYVDYLDADTEEDSTAAAALRRDVIDPFLQRDPATLDPALTGLQKRIRESVADEDVQSAD